MAGVTSVLNRKIFWIVSAVVVATFALINTMPVHAATTKTWVPTTGGAWTTAGNWSPSGAPATGDDVIINSNQSANISSVPTITLNSLTVSGNALLAAASSGNTITITSSIGVSSGKTLTLGASGARVVFVLNGTGTVDGTLAFDAGTTVRNFTVNGTLVVGPSGQVVDPALSTGSAFILSSGATLKTGKTGGISTGTTANANVAINFGGTYSYSNTANYEYIGSANQSVGNGLPSTVASLKINNTGGSGNNTVTLASAETITNSLTIASGILSVGTFTTHTADSLYFGAVQQSNGTWGSTSSTASNKNDSYFAGTGKITIASSGADTIAPILSSVSPASSSIIKSVTTLSQISFTTDETLANGSVTITRTSGTADANSPHVCTLNGTALTVGTHTVDLSDTVNSCTSDVSNLVSGAVYSFAFAGSDAATNAATQVTRSSVSFDSTAPVFTSTTPTSSSAINNVTASSAIAYTTSESLASGTVTFTRSSGTADANSPHVCTLNGTALASGAHTINLADTTNSCTADVSNLVSGTVYTLAFAGLDTAGNPATTVTYTGINFDTTSPVFSSLSPASSSTINNVTTTSTVSFSVNESLLSGSVTLTRTGGAADAGSPHVCALTGAALTSGAHTINLASSGITCATDASNLVSGTIYSITFSGQDVVANPAGSASVTNILFDNAGPVLSTVTPASSSTVSNVTTTSALGFTTDEALANGTITLTRSSGTADANSPHVCTLKGSSLNTGTHTIDLADTTNSCTSDVSNLVSGTVYSVSFSMQDVPLNPASSVTRTGITFNSNVPTITEIDSTVADGAYTIGQIIDVQVTFSEIVTSTGLVTVTLSTGGSCTFTVTSSSTASCNYTVTSGESSADLDVSTISGVIKNDALSDMVNFVPTTTFAANKAIVIDTTAPSTPSASPIAGLYNSTQAVSLSATGATQLRYSTVSTPANCTSGSVYSGAITVSTSQTLYVLACDAATNTSSANFAYVIDTTPPSTPVASPSAGLYNSTQSVTLSASGSSTIKYSTSSVPADCTSGTAYTSAITVSSDQTVYVRACDTAGNSSTANFAYVIDTTPPSTPVASPSAGLYNSTQSVTLSASGSSTIRYSTTSTPTDCVSSTAYTGAITVSSSQTIYTKACDAAGNTSSASFSYTIDTTVPTISNVTSTLANGTYGVDQIIPVSVTFSETVTSTGSITITLDTGGSCTFTITAATNASCDYTVTSGQSSADLTVSSISGTVNDTALNTLTNFVPAANLASNKDIAIDTTPPSDADSDGLANIIEQTAPNSGDANNDGTQDSAQPNVTSLVNPVTNNYAVLQSTCAVNDSVSIMSDNPTKDSQYGYPAGLLNFTLSCGVGLTATITQYFYGTYDLSKTVARKYNSTTHTFTTVANADLSNVTIGGGPALKIVYTITDGGVLDEDGIANGTIVDPLGPAVLTASKTTTVSAPNTGLQHRSLLGVVSAMFSGILMFAAVMLPKKINL